MAPEQAAGQRGGVTTAADVYGLGAVLYELLTGRPPHQGPTPLDVLRKVIDEEPPGTRSLNPAVGRDLDIICRKCLDKEPSRRYASAAAVAYDLRCYLAGEPIQARPVRTPERLWRWTRRQPVVAGLVLALAAVLTLGLALTVPLWVSAELHLEEAKDKGDKLTKQNDALAEALERAQQAEKRAEENEKQAKEEKALVEADFRRAHALAQKLGKMSDRLEQSPGTHVTRQEMLETALNYYQEFIRRRGDDPQLQLELADAQFESAMILSALRGDAAALEAFAKARDMYRPLADAAPSDPDLQRKLGNCINNIGTHEKNVERARADFDEARGIYERALDDHRGDKGLLIALANSLSNLGSLNIRTGAFDEARDCLRRAVAVDKRLLELYPQDIDATSGLAAAYQNLGVLCERLPGGREEALDCQLRACDLRKALADSDVGNDPRRKADYAASLTSIGMILRDKGERDEALKRMEEARVIRETLVKQNPGVPRYPFDLAHSYTQIGVTLSQKEDKHKALDCYMKALGLYRELARNDPTGASCRRELGQCWFNISVMHGHFAWEASSHGDHQKGTDEWNEERDALAEARPLQEKAVDADPSNIECRLELASTLDNLGLVLWRFHRLLEAHEVLQEGVEKLRPAVEKAPHARAPRQALSDMLVNLSLVERAAGRPSDAVAVTRDRLELVPDNADELYRGALELAATVPLFGKGRSKPTEEELADRGRCADLAMQTLRRAADKGFADLKRLEKDREFDVLRDRDDYKALAAELEKKSAPSKDE
jgi:tetratricopeptide (TPR) repeat protein